MRILQIVPRIANDSSGPSISVPALCNALVENGSEVTLFALEPQPNPQRFANSRFFPCNQLPFAYRLGVSSAMKKAIQSDYKDYDVIHTNSLWMMPNIYPGSTANSGRLVVSPRGTLSPWALNRARLRKRVLWAIFQKNVLARAACLHATSEEELNQIRAVGLSNPVAVIPNGIESQNLRRFPSDRGTARNLLYLARIHPTKGLSLLLEAWSALHAEFPNWTLRIAGPLEGDYPAEMQQLATRLKLPRVTFLGELRGQQKSAEYHQADLYVLPTQSENFGMSIAEALSYGIPTIVTEGAPWSKLNEIKAGWWIPRHILALVTTLRSAMTISDEDRRQIGIAGHQWIQEDFRWKAIGSRMTDVYKWLVQGGSPPSSVSL